MNRIPLHLRNLLCLLACWSIAATAFPCQAQESSHPYQAQKQSVLSSGPSLKIGVTQDGVYRIRYEDLVSAGLTNQAEPSSNIALYGNKSGMLPYFNTPDIPDDLSPLPIWIQDGGDGTFGPGDYFLFLGQSPHIWTYDTSHGFLHQTNYYSDTTYYFVSLNPVSTCRIENATETGQGDTRITTSIEHVHHENDLSNICNGSVHWLGERFSSSGESQTVTLSTPDPANGNQKNAKLLIQTAVQTNNGTASFTIHANGENMQINHTGATGSNAVSPCTDMRSLQQELSISASQTSIVFTYQKSNAASSGFIDFIDLLYERSLRVRDQALFFRNPAALNQKASFILQADAGLQVWDITNVYRIRKLSVNQSGTSYSFTAAADSILHEYVAFHPNNASSPASILLQKEQNLHGANNIDYILVTHPQFLDYANQIADMHRERNGYSVLVATTDQIYNEFSSGAKDPSAIRMLAKHLWDKSDSLHRPRHLLLLGAASYDYKGRLGHLTDFVPTFESLSNLHEGGGDPIEDNFGYMGENEGFSPGESQGRGNMDIAVGRLPIRNQEDAEAVVEKIDIYSSPEYLYDARNPNLPGNLGDWRNEISFVCDDGFESRMESDILANNWPDTRIPAFHINKLYSDAYERVSSSTSNRVPAIESNIRTAIEEGNLFIGYYGHSGWDAWSDERILSIDIINQLKESLSYPIMFSSSCTFGYFDYIDRPSAAELLVLRPRSGAIAIVTTTRTAYTGAIESILKLFIQKITERASGQVTTIGDAYLYAKQRHTGGAVQKFALLGDPGLRTATPRYNVQTLQINGQEASSKQIDTLKALSPITIEGCITDHQGRLLEDFNGTVITKVYDKSVMESTLGNYNPQSNTNNRVITFQSQNSLLFQGYSDVKDGRFSVSFIVPKDIQYNYGNGKIEYYAYSNTSDANGCFEDIVVGGFDAESVLDTMPPIVDLYINRNNYIPGTVGESPYLYAEISDRFGINTTGTGIGHNMTLVIDEDFSNPIVVNNLFRYNPGSYTEGTLSYPLNLERGEHTAQLKVWNINNISTTESISFRIGESDEPEIFEIRAIPNPVKNDYVDIYFNHNGYGGGIEQCEVNIFNLQGRRIASFDYPVEDISGYSIGPIRWDMSRTNGGRVQSGMYIAHIRAHHADGNISHKTVKIIVLK